MNPSKADVEYLLKLARDKSVAGRTELVSIVSDLFFGEHDVLTDHERQLMDDILRQLIHDVEMSVRQKLAERLARQSDAPRDLILALANDEIEVAHPILTKSTVLHDLDLIEIISHRTREHQLAIAMREELAEGVSEALVGTGNGDVIERLIENKGARISRATLDYLVAQSKENHRYQEPLLQRPDLGEELGKKMYWWVSAALRKHILDNFDIDETALDDEIESTVLQALDEVAKFDATKDKPGELAERLDEAGVITPKLLIQVLRQGEVVLFESLFVKFTAIRLNLVQRILFESGGQGLAITCKAMETEKADFASIFLLSRKARPGDKTVDPGELSRAMELYDRIKADAAKTVLARWRREQPYLESIQSLENDSDDGAG